MNSFWNCGCGGYEPDEEEWDEIIREIEEEREDEPILIPVEAPIPAENWPTRRRVEVEVE
jgi:hypothetical protein